MPKPLDIAALVRHRKILLLQPPKHCLILGICSNSTGSIVSKRLRIAFATTFLCPNTRYMQSPSTGNARIRIIQGHFKRSVLVLGVNA